MPSPHESRVEPDSVPLPTLSFFLSLSPFSSPTPFFWCSVSLQGPFLAGSKAVKAVALVGERSVRRRHIERWSRQGLKTDGGEGREQSQSAPAFWPGRRWGHSPRQGPQGCSLEGDRGSPSPEGSEEAQERSKMKNHDREVMGSPRGRGSPRVMNGMRGERRPGQNPSLRCKLNGSKKEESVGRRLRKNTWKVRAKVKRGK